MCFASDLPAMTMHATSSAASLRPEVDLTPDLAAKTLTVRLHCFSHNARDIAVRHLCEQLNDTETIFPGTDLRVVYEQIGSE